MRALDAAIRAIERATDLFGRLTAWLVLAMVALTFANVVLRYLYGVSFVRSYEAALYAFGMVLTSAAGWALMTNEHVRVDVIYGGLGVRGRALVDLFGSVAFLFPFVWFVWARGLPYVQRSWAIREGSTEISGIPYLYVLKSFILVFAVALGAQGVAFALRALRAALTGIEAERPRP